MIWYKKCKQVYKWFVDENKSLHVLINQVWSRKTNLENIVFYFLSLSVLERIHGETNLFLQKVPVLRSVCLIDVCFIETALQELDKENVPFLNFQSVQDDRFRECPSKRDSTVILSEKKKFLFSVHDYDRYCQLKPRL